MDASMSVFKESILFDGIEPSEIMFLLQCLAAYERDFFKNEYLYRFGDQIDAIGLVISGKVHVFNEDHWGNKTMMTEIRPGGIFGETFAASGPMLSTVTAVAAEDSRILFLDMRRVLSTCTKACDFHHRLIRNLVAELAQKNIQLNEKISHMSKRTTQEKLLSYLSAQSRKAGSLSFEIPFNRQQLADYLHVERTAMSKELSKLKSEQVIDFERRHFVIKDKAKSTAGYLD